MMKSICLPVDGSIYTDSQLRHAITFARAFDATVRVLSIIDVRLLDWAVVMGTNGFVPVVPSSVYKEESKRILEEKSQAVLEKCATILTENKVAYTTQQIQGAPADVICEQAHHVDIIFIGARGEFAKWKRNLVGATVDAVVRQWPKPILITPQKYQPIKKILFAYDGSDRSNRALQLVGYCASHLDLPVCVLTVSDKEGLRKRVLAEAGTYLDNYGAKAELIGVPGSPEKEIIRLAAERECNFMIMGAFGHSRIREAILGSTTEQIMRSAQLPVLLSK